ncbi:hypothetical protein JTE90_011039 [Oedothorax gibbosus]|uniref:Uncharacterized protein n=1 Tax=Oedothorax gibbosus TaxID=931172 RepID=A0AAV6VCN6_9ARAC|nr:hypothetical protein JTE90_011039 [Oedothorax gibbosus]
MLKNALIAVSGSCVTLNLFRESAFTWINVQRSQGPEACEVCPAHREIGSLTNHPNIPVTPRGIDPLLIG